MILRRNRETVRLPGRTRSTTSSAFRYAQHVNARVIRAGHQSTSPNGRQACLPARPAQSLSLSCSDRGAQYTSRLLAGWAAANGVRLSVGRTGSCHDNAVAESFFATLKNEMYSLRSWPTRAEARSAVVGFIEGYYNRRRPHSTIGYQTPAGKMEAFFERTAPKPEKLPLAA